MQLSPLRIPVPHSATDLSDAEPTLTHMGIARLHEQKLVRAQSRTSAQEGSCCVTSQSTP